MAWEDVPTKLAQYDEATYAPNREGMTASNALLLEFDVTQVSDLPVHRRTEFEDALDYRLGACVNLASSRAWPNLGRK